MAEYERIPYSSFIFNFGSTSFRTCEFNKATEWQLQLLDDFWKKPENKDQGWEKKYMCPGQKDIYEIKNRYYDWLVENEFIKGDEDVKYKTAREKTSGLYDMGLINENHRLTEVGRKILEMSKSQAYLENTELGISKDSLLYLQQLLKLSDTDQDRTIRPFIIILYLINKHKYFTFDEFRYLIPLCYSPELTENISNAISQLRSGEGSINQVIIESFLSKENHQRAIKRFIENEFEESLLLSVSMNRKSPDYDKKYVPLYLEMKKVYIDGNHERIIPLFEAVNKLSSGVKQRWKKLLFDTPLKKKVYKNPDLHIKKLQSHITESEKNLKEFFYITMHLFKAKATLEDYFDLNKRYLGLTNCFIFDEDEVKLDVVPKHFFANAIDELYKDAYTASSKLEQLTALEEIHPSLKFVQQNIISGINLDLGTNISTIEEAISEVDKIRYERFNKLVNQKFTNEALLELLNHFDTRNDVEIGKNVTDNADVPTIFEYILGIIWWKISGRQGKILDFLKLSLDANLLPITHAAGGEADIVYEYRQTDNYPEHNLLLEATLAERGNQRRQEMEPVSRHMGNHLLKTRNFSSYCVFATTYLHTNVIGDFIIRKNAIYCDAQNPDDYICGMKIIPISTADLRYIITNNITYDRLYSHFEKAHQTNEPHPTKWYENHIMLANSGLANN